jgi:predicted  nucleic acid-binding Zn-ribbon protein
MNMITSDKIKKIIHEMLVEMFNEVDDVPLESEPEETNVSDADKRELEKAKKQKDDITNKINDFTARIQKLEEPVKRQVQRIELQKGSEQKKLGAVTRRITDLQQKMGD